MDDPHLYDDGLVLNPDCGFDSFVVGPSNRLAHAAAQAVVANPGRAYNPLFIHGLPGTGKTYLLQAICLAIRNKQPDAVVYYTSCEGFMTQFMDAVASGTMARFRHKFRHVDVLAIDDIHFLAKRDRTQEEFFHTFNSLYQSHKQIVLSSDASPEEIPELEERLVARFKGGLVAPIGPPDYETRLQILKNKAQLRGLELPEAVAQSVASRIDSNIRELEGAVVKLQMMATMDKRPVDMELVNQAFGAGSEVHESATTNENLTKLKKATKNPVAAKPPGDEPLELRINVPADATDDEIKHIVQEFVLAANALHLAHGGSGLEIDSVDIGVRAGVGQGVLT